MTKEELEVLTNARTEVVNIEKTFKHWESKLEEKRSKVSLLAAACDHRKPDGSSALDECLYLYLCSICGKTL